MGPRENGHRPAIDVLFRSAASAYGPRVIGVILTGTLDDGASGLQQVKTHGGATIVQDPQDALYSEMPLNAMNRVEVDHILPLAGIGPLLARLIAEPLMEESIIVPNKGKGMEEKDESLVQQVIKESVNGDRPGDVSIWVCPECGGSMWELRDGDVIRFQCHVGHAYSPESLLEEQSQALEEALWTAYRALEDRRTMILRLASDLRKRGSDLSAVRFEEEAREVSERAEIVRKALEIKAPQSPSP